MSPARAAITSPPPPDKIVAQPATLTGSIGVVAGKMIVTGLWSTLGVSWGTVQEGANAGMFSTLEDYTPEGERRFESFLDSVLCRLQGSRRRRPASRHGERRARRARPRMDRRGG